MAQKVPSHVTAIQSAENTVELAVAVLTMLLDTPDGRKYHCVLPTKQVEVTTVNGKRSYSFNSAYEIAAKAKGWDGADADPVAVTRALKGDPDSPIWISHKSKDGKYLHQPKMGLRSADWKPGTKPAASSNAADFGL